MDIAFQMRIKSKKRGRPYNRNRFKIERLKNGWSQKDVSQIVFELSKKKITKSHIGQIERGKCNPSIELAEILAKIFNLPIEELLS